MKSFGILPRRIVSVVAAFCFFSLTPLLSFASTNLALNKPVTASSSQNSSFTPRMAVDDNLSSRWSSDFTDNNWIAVDLGGQYQITGVKFHWQNSYAKDYHIQVSNDGLHWTTIHTTRDNPGGIDEVSLSGVGRYLRMQGLRRATRHGYSMYDFEVYGQPARTENIALNKPATASTTQNGRLSANNAVDGDSSTRWSSDFTDHNWIAVDLGAVYQITGAHLSWQNSYSKDFDIQTSFDGVHWATIHSTIDSDGGIDEMALNGQGRYLRVEGFRRATRYGHSLWDLKVFGHVIMPVDPEVETESSSFSSSHSEESTSETLALNKPVVASSVENSGLGAALAVDGDVSTRWSSDFSDHNWIAVDLGSVHDINGVSLYWQNSYSKDYHIQTSLDGVHWTLIHTTRDSEGGTEHLNVTGQGRYLRVEGLRRATRFGHSLWELEVSGTPALTDSSSPSSSSNSSSSSTSSSNSSSPSETVDDTAPSVPANLKASHIDLGSVSLSWRAATDDVEVVSYVLYRDGAELIELLGSNQSYADTGLLSGTIYSYSLKAIDAAGNVSELSAALTLSTLTPTEPETGMTLEWVTPQARENGTYLELSEIGGYEIQFKKAADSDYQLVVLENPAATQYKFEGLEGGDYEFKIAVFDTNGLYSQFVEISPVGQ